MPKRARTRGGGRAQRSAARRARRKAAVIEWNGDEIIKEMQAKIEKNLDVAAEGLRGQIVKNLSVPFSSGGGRRVIRYHPRRVGSPSKPGEYPRADLGKLRQNIFWDRSSRFVRRVGTTLKYGLYLELGTRRMLPRPYLRRTLRELDAKLAKIVTRGFRA